MKKIIAFKSTTCGPCKMITPILKELSDEGFNIREVFIDDELGKNEAAMYGVRAVPTVFILNEDDDILNTLVGYRPKKDILTYLQ